MLEEAGNLITRMKAAGNKGKGSFSKLARDYVDGNVRGGGLLGGRLLKRGGIGEGERDCHGATFSPGSRGRRLERGAEKREGLGTGGHRCVA